jgi:cytochrome P450
MAAEDGAFDLGEAMLGLAYEVIARTAFSADAVSDPPAFSRAIAAYFHSLGRLDLATYLQLPEWMPTLGRCQARAPLALFRREIGGIIARRAAALVRQGLDGVPDDLLTRLMTERDPQTGLPLTDALIYDNALVFLAAGHETTAGLLTWTLFLLGNHPDWEARVAAELASARATDGTVSLESAPLTRAVLDETMRLYPPVPFIPRMTKAPDRLGPLDLKKGSVVFAAPFVSHRHHAHWERPDAFDPDRFLTGRDPDRHVFFPFGLGPRICIGARFAMQEAVIALAALLPEHRVELTAPERVMPRANITLKPAAPVVARLLPRALRPRADRNASRYTPPPAP